MHEANDVSSRVCAGLKLIFCLSAYRCMLAGHFEQEAATERADMHCPQAAAPNAVQDIQRCGEGRSSPATQGTACWEKGYGKMLTSDIDYHHQIIKSNTLCSMSGRSASIPHHEFERQHALLNLCEQIESNSVLYLLCNHWPSCLHVPAASVMF